MDRAPFTEIGDEILADGERFYGERSLSDPLESRYDLR